MSRSRILNRIHRVIRQQMAGSASDHALLTRREALKLSAMTLGGVALGAMAWPKLGWARAASRTPRIGIVGAGISGLTAALTLRDSGVGCSMYEASTRIGGRMHSDASFGGRAR